VSGVRSPRGRSWLASDRAAPVATHDLGDAGAHGVDPSGPLLGAPTGLVHIAVNADRVDVIDRDLGMVRRGPQIPGRRTVAVGRGIAAAGRTVVPFAGDDDLDCGVDVTDIRTGQVRRISHWDVVAIAGASPA